MHTEPDGSDERLFFMLRSPLSQHIPQFVKPLIAILCSCIPLSVVWIIPLFFGKGEVKHTLKRTWKIVSVESHKLDLFRCHFQSISSPAFPVSEWYAGVTRTSFDAGELQYDSVSVVHPFQIIHNEKIEKTKPVLIKVSSRTLTTPYLFFHLYRAVLTEWMHYWIF